MTAAPEVDCPSRWSSSSLGRAGRRRRPEVRILPLDAPASPPSGLRRDCRREAAGEGCFRFRDGRDFRCCQTRRRRRRRSRRSRRRYTASPGFVAASTTDSATAAPATTRRPTWGATRSDGATRGDGATQGADATSRGATTSGVPLGDDGTPPTPPPTRRPPASRHFRFRRFRWPTTPTPGGSSCRARGGGAPAGNPKHSWPGQ